jgi:hypothetical protein
MINLTIVAALGFAGANRPRLIWEQQSLLAVLYRRVLPICLNRHKSHAIPFQQIGRDIDDELCDALATAK